MHDIQKLHTLSHHHLALLKLMGEGHCFCCFKQFLFSDIVNWWDKGMTAVCPRCGVDSVLPAIPGITDEVLWAMEHYWFGMGRGLAFQLLQVFSQVAEFAATVPELKWTLYTDTQVGLIAGLGWHVRIGEELTGIYPNGLASAMPMQVWPNIDVSHQERRRLVEQMLRAKGVVFWVQDD